MSLKLLILGAIAEVAICTYLIIRRISILEGNLTIMSNTETEAIAGVSGQVDELLATIDNEHAEQETLLAELKAEIENAKNDQTNISALENISARLDTANARVRSIVEAAVSGGDTATGDGSGEPAAPVVDGGAATEAGVTNEPAQDQAAPVDTTADTQEFPASEKLED